MHDEFYPINTNSQAWEQIQNGVGNRINSHIKKLLTEEKDGTRISVMKKVLHSSSANFIHLLKTWSHYNVEPLCSWKSPALNYQLHFNLYNNNLYLTLNSKPNWTLKIETVTTTFLLHISNGDNCVKYGKDFFNWTCSRQNPFIHFSKIISNSSKYSFEIDDSHNKIIDFWKNDLWRYFKFSQPMIRV